MADTIELGLDPGVITWTPSSLLLGEENVYSDNSELKFIARIFGTKNYAFSI